jgi:hypothetical protein
MESHIIRRVKFTYEIQSVRHKTQHKVETGINKETGIKAATPSHLRNNKYFQHFLSHAAQVHCLASVFLATSCAIILQLTTRFFKEEVYVLFYIGEVWFRLSGYISFKTAEYGVPKTHMHPNKILHIRHRLVFVVQCLENEILSQCSLKTITEENYADI